MSKRTGMERKKLILIGFLLLVISSACHQSTGDANRLSNASPSTSSTNTNRADNSNAGMAGQKTGGAPGEKPKDSKSGLLEGTYAITEVQHDGIIEMITPENTTMISFQQPASFSRVAKSKGKVSHTDSGQFSIAGSSLTLRIMLSQDKIQINPVEKRFSFSLSADGEELKLTSDKNKTAVFRKMKSPAPAKS